MMLGHRLLKRGILGINNRNANFTLKYNSRRFYPLVDDKLKTKQLAIKEGISVPELYGVVEIERQIRDLPAFLERYSDFVIKPSKGSGGDGILVISGRAKAMYRKANGLLMDTDELCHHVSNILGGMYSLGGQTDKALVEYRVEFDPIFKDISYLGVPDIRIIVFFGVPVMAMVRLPTKLSDGKANLHQGAIGVGIDMATGKTLSAVWRDDIVDEHPDTGNPVTGFVIKDWDILLHLAARCYELTGLVYQGVDIVLDHHKGPMILELNARPGLNIQIANQAGLLARLKMVEDNIKNITSLDGRIAFAKIRFRI